MTVILVSVTLVVLLVIAAYLAASETSLMRVSRIRVRYLVENEVARADKLERLVENPGYFLPSLLLMILVVQLTTASLATWMVTRLTNNAGVGVAAGTAVATVFMFVFGELIPKASASHNSERMALRVTRPITLLSKFLHPLAVLFEYIANGVLRLFHRKGLTTEMIVTDEGEIKAMVSAAGEYDVIEEEEKEMIHSVFEFGDTMVREVMVPRPDMVTLPHDAAVKDALALAIKHGYSRIPVHGDNLDDIVGVIYAKDLMKYLQKGNIDHGIEEIVRDAYVIPETKNLSELLRELRERKVHMSIVVDEYGTVAGLVTIEDLLEEIVGEIFDEFDLEVKLVDQVASNRFQVDARVNIDDINEKLGIKL
ncbi:MAG: hemolysin family protein, partial [Actinobacteria bacterium]|nr:hemolysin family protein [Actinomycetota bacterium]